MSFSESERPRGAMVSADPPLRGELTTRQLHAMLLERGVFRTSTRLLRRDDGAATIVAKATWRDARGRARTTSAPRSDVQDAWMAVVALIDARRGELSP